MESTITTTIKELLSAMGILDISVHKEEMAGQIVFRIETKDPKKIIGTRGETLRMLDYLVKKIAEKKGVESNHYMVDVDGYRTQHLKELQQKAVMMADRAKSFEYDVELNPMSAYERLIVHATLADVPNIKTESQGEGRERRVVIRYTPA